MDLDRRTRVDLVTFLRGDMPTSEGIDNLRIRLRNWKWWPPNAILNEVVALGQPGTKLLVEEFTRRLGPEQLLIAAALGGAQGNEGIDELRAAVKKRGPGRSDLRNASLGALIRRCHGNAAGDLADALQDRDPALKSLAMLGLAAYGDERAWELAFSRLIMLMRRPPKVDSIPPDKVVAVCYLGINASDSTRVLRLGQAIRKYWQRLSFEIQTHIKFLWPEVCDFELDITEIPPPNGHRMRKWVLEQLLFNL